MTSFGTRRGTTSLCAKVFHLDSHAAAMRIVPPIKMHDNIEKEHLGHRERLFDTLSLDLALLSKIIVHFDSSFSDKLWHTETEKSVTKPSVWVGLAVKVFTVFSCQ